MPDKLVEYFPNSVIFNLIQNEKAVSEDIVNYKIFNRTIYLKIYYLKIMIIINF